MANSDRTPARNLAVLGLLAAVLYAAKLAMAWMPNIEPVSLLVMVYISVLGTSSYLCLHPAGDHHLGIRLLVGLLPVCVADSGSGRPAAAADGILPGMGGAVWRIRPVLRGAVCPDLLGVRRLGLRAELVDLRHSLRRAPLRGKLCHGPRPVPALPEASPAAGRSSGGPVALFPPQYA